MMTTPARRPPTALPAPAIALGCILGLASAISSTAAEKTGEVAGAPGPASVTFTKDVAPLVFSQCASCHRPGEVAPFPLLSYADVSKRAGLIRTVIEGRNMPPWKAEPGFGHFSNERRLSDDQVATIRRWVEAGAPEGDPADLPPRPKFTAGWQLGEPDMVVRMEEPYRVEAEGRDVYRCFVLPFQPPEGQYLEAVEYRPGNRRVVHHAVVTSLAHDKALAKLAEGDGKSFGSGLNPPGQILPGPLGIWTPGMVPHPMPDGLAADWPKGADLVLQLHLHPGGKPETEQSSLGLHFTDRKPTGRMKLMVMSNNKIDIPPDTAEHVMEATTTLREPVDVHGVFPHMHLIARTVKATATLPDGTSVPIISIADWDFQWQHYYEYASPLKLPASTRIDARWTYDNSAANPANPSSPPRRVTFGEQTADEMAFLVLDVVSTGPARKPPAPAAGAGSASDEMTARRAALVFGQMDKNGDGRLTLEENVAVLGDHETPAEIERRLVKFDRDGDKQLNLAELTEGLRFLGRQ
jgi:mono/diheme cytochrome c family protein